MVLYMYMYVCICVHVCYVCVCLSWCVCACVCMCPCMCVCVCVCVPTFSTDNLYQGKVLNVKPMMEIKMKWRELHGALKQAIL